MALRIRRWEWPSLLVVVLLAGGLIGFTPGCGPDYKARAVVKGRVTMNKKPLTIGNVMFHNSNGITSSASIDPQGNYSMKDAPIGDCIITVTVDAPPRDPSVKKRMKSGGKDLPGSKDVETGQGFSLMPDMPGEVVRIPDKFSKPETSGLSYKVEKGEHIHDIEL